jgi:hypothetical protein
LDFCNNIDPKQNSQHRDDPPINPANVGIRQYDRLPALATDLVARRVAQLNG